MDNSEIHDIVERIDEIVSNKNDEPLDQLGSYIVGATLVREDTETLFSKYPELETIAELGAELETLEGSVYEKEVFINIKTHLNALKLQVKDGR